jgi:hypothetical protein
MILKRLPQREHLLSIWAKDRLADRETVEWAVGALKEIRSSLGEDTANLLELLDRWANESPSLDGETKKVWRLLRQAAKESRADPESWFAVHNIKEKAEAGTLRTEDADRLIDCFRPRLRAKELSSWAKTNRDPDDNRPLRWVNWDFKTSIQNSYQPHVQLEKSQFAKFPAELLSRLLERGTTALRDALNLAAEIEWVGGKRDLPNHHVHRVYIPEKELPEGDAKEVEDRDPDALNNNFAPLIRTITGALFALADKNSSAAQTLIVSWKLEDAGLFVRLFAVAGWRPDLVNSDTVGEFLENVNNHAFWRWMIFPEIATLRALRWNDLGMKYKSPLATRLLEGPGNDTFLSDEEIPAATKLFHRDHELARLVDNQCDVPPEFNELVAQRREADERFPAQIPAVEQGQEAVRARWVPDGDPNIFADVPLDQLLANLLAESGQRNFERGNDAEAFGRSLDGKRRILEALSRSPADQEQINTAWNLLLSYPHEKTQDTEAGRAATETIAKLALALPQATFRNMAGQLCYWLDSAEEIFPKFERADELWLALLPFAASEANQKQASEDASDEVDLTMAALNEPLGHLLSMFIRRCPSMPAKKEDRPPLPVEFVEPLKSLSGRAKELLANRMVVLIRYFVLADREWLEDAVTSVLVADGIASDRLWEAFAKYGQIPPPEVWSTLQHSVFRSVLSSKLSPEAKRRLAEMSVIVWVWSKDAENKFELDSGSLRSAFGLANDDVRGAAAWQFSHLFHSKDAGQTGDEDGQNSIELWPRLGAAFFQEIWPLEPALQSAATANDFARIPAGVGTQYFAEALSVVLPYLLPFEVWAVVTEFQLDPDKPTSKAIVTAFPEDTLVLLAVCISEKQGHSVYDLKKVLDWIVEARPNLEHGYRMRLLRRMA